MVKNLPANAVDVQNAGSIPGSGRFPGSGNGNAYQYCSLENFTDRGGWFGLGGGWPIVQRVSKSDTTVYLSTHACKQKERSKIVSFFADGIDFSTEKIDLTTKLS